MGEAADSSPGKGPKAAMSSRRAAHCQRRDRKTLNLALVIEWLYVLMWVSQGLSPGLSCRPN